MNLCPAGSLHAVRRPGPALCGKGAVVGGVMVPDEEDGVRMILADVFHRVSHGLIGLLARQGAIDEVVDHVHDNEGTVIHISQRYEKLLNVISNRNCKNK